MPLGNLEVSQTIIIPAPIDQVWKFLINGEKMKSWFQADEFIIEIWEGGNIEIPFSYGGEKCLVKGEMGLLIPQEKFVFTWNETNEYGEDWFNTTNVSINLEEIDDGTELTLIHNGFKYLPAEIQEEVFQRYATFWAQSGILDRLCELILSGFDNL
jgi:uncharacterized protein YndB with AHSA1/START domain